MFRLNIRSSLLGTCAAAALAMGASSGAHAQVTQINGGGSTLAALIYGSIFGNITGQLDATVNFNYAAVGSGAGARGVLCNDGTQVPVGGVNPTTVHYGASDNPLSSGQVTAWNTNAAQSGCASNTGGIANDGPLLQVPTIGTPVTLAYNIPKQISNGGIKLTDTQLCNIFSGNVTSWDDASLTGANAVATKNPPHGTITVVYRSDGSGTSALFTAHLATACAGMTLPITFSSTQTFINLFATKPTNFVGASGSGNVAAAIGLNAALNNGTISGTSESIGYLSPDYTQMAPLKNGGAYPPVAKVVNTHSAAAVLPDYANTVAALNTTTWPSGVDLTKGTNYIPTAPDPAVGYPIVGYTTFILPVCYKDNNAVNGIYEFFGQITANPSYLSLIQQQGFVQLPAPVVGVLNANILNNNNGYNIDIQDATICQGAGASGPGTYAGR